MSAAARHQQGLLDTSAVLALSTLHVDHLPDEPLISTITLAELSMGPLATDDMRERSARQSVLQQAESDFDPLPFDAAAARAFGRVATDLRQAGRKRTARAYDALIAAVALSNDLPLFTANPGDFASITDLVVVPVRPER